MSERRDPFHVERTPDAARIAVARARKRMIEAASRPIAVKWRAMRRGDRIGSPQREPPPRETA
ncbi:MAG: hypothetical protein JWP87_2622 [Labilithrix sp.]|nr:hypothetical protein [Labilithrix sp.]